MSWSKLKWLHEKWDYVKVYDLKEKEKIFNYIKKNSHKVTDEQHKKNII